MNIVYKVVNRFFESARFGRVQYEIGKFVYAPDNTQLFCFKTLEAAKEFAFGDELIFEAEAGYTFAPKVIPIYCGIEEYWRLRSAKRKIVGVSLDYGAPPKGTLFTRKLKLIKKVNYPY